MGRALVLSLVVSCLTFGCKKPPTDDRPEATPHEMYVEQERIQKGEVVGEPLRAPKVVVDATRVTVNGHLVITRGELAVPDWRSQKLFTWAKGLREHWKMIHPGDSFSAAADVTLPPDLSNEEKPPPLPPVSNGTSKLRAGALTVTGALSPEVVTGVLTGANPFVQQCYETALTRNPGLMGRASTKLSIDETGTVVMATNFGSDIPDSELTSCVAKQFAALRFPKPEKGTVTVVYPLLLEPEKFNSKLDAGAHLH